MLYFTGDCAGAPAGRLLSNVFGTRYELALDASVLPWDPDRRTGSEEGTPGAGARRRAERAAGRRAVQDAAEGASCARAGRTTHQCPRVLLGTYLCRAKNRFGLINIPHPLACAGRVGSPCAGAWHSSPALFVVWGVQ